MPFSRRALLRHAARLAALPGLPAAAAAAAALPFVLIGDWGRHGRDNQIDVANQMARTADAIGSRFVVSLGDNFYEDGVTGLDDPYWRTSFEDIYSAPALQTPWRITLGNHDYRGNVQAQLDYSQLSPRWRLPARYYSAAERLPDGGTAEFFYLDTSPFIREYIGSRTDISGQDPAAQAAWLDQALGRSGARWKIVIGHHPIYTAASNKDHDQPDMVARIAPILRRHAVPLYVNGHEHNLQSTRVDGTVFVTNGAGSLTYAPGAALRRGFSSPDHGFMTCRLSSEKLDFALVNMAGQTVYADRILPG